MRFVELNEQMKGSVVSMGCMRISNKSDEEIDRLIHTALDTGVNHFDHANIYGGGQSEEVFGRWLAKNPGIREKILIQSKCGIRPGAYDFSKEHILSEVEGSLKRLGVTYLDTLLLHRPDALMEPEEVSEAFSKLEKEGKVRSFGVSNFNPMQRRLLQSGLSQKLIVNQMQFSLMHTPMIDFGIHTNTRFDGAINREGGVLEDCRLEHMTLQAWSPFQHGFFEGVFVDNEKFPKLNQALAELAEIHHLTKSGIAVAWLLRHPVKQQVVLGTTTPERMREMAAGADCVLSRTEWYQLYLAAGNQLP